MFTVAFLVIELLSVFSLISRRKNVLSLYEQGFTYNKITCRFAEIAKLETNFGGKINCEILINSGEKIVLNDSIDGIEDVVKMIEAKTKVLFCKD